MVQQSGSTQALLRNSNQALPRLGLGFFKSGLGPDVAELGSVSFISGQSCKKPKLPTPPDQQMEHASCFLHPMLPVAAVSRKN